MTSKTYSANSHTIITHKLPKKTPLYNGARVLVSNGNVCDCEDCAPFARHFNGTMLRLNGDLVDVRNDNGKVDCWPVGWVTVVE